MRMWPNTTNPSIEPPNPRKMPGRPKKNRRKRKGEPKKFGKISKKGVKMTCSICKRYGHNKSHCAVRFVQESTSQPSSACGETTAPPKDTQTGYNSQPSSVCGDTASVPRAPKKKVQGGLGRGLGRKKLMQKELHLLVRLMILLATRDHIVLPYLLLLLEETKGPQLVLVYTLILQLGVKCLILVHQVRGFYMD